MQQTNLPIPLSRVNTDITFIKKINAELSIFFDEVLVDESTFDAGVRAGFFVALEVIETAPTFYNNYFSIYI